MVAVPYGMHTISSLVGTQDSVFFSLHFVHVVVSVGFQGDDMNGAFFGEERYSGGRSGSESNWPGLGGRPPLVIHAPRCASGGGGGKGGARAECFWFCVPVLGMWIRQCA